MFLNIILNAAEAMQGSGFFTVRTGIFDDGQYVLILISDTGPGIPSEVKMQTSIAAAAAGKVEAGERRNKAGIPLSRRS